MEKIRSILFYVILGVLAVCAISAFAVFALGLIPVAITFSILGLIVFSIKFASSST